MLDISSECCGWVTHIETPPEAQKAQHDQEEGGVENLPRTLDIPTAAPFTRIRL